MRTTYWVPGARRRGFSLVAGLALLCLAGTMVSSSPARAAEAPSVTSELLTTGDGYGQPRGSSTVRALQLRLRTLGLRPGPVDGLFGPQTETAVEGFQHTAGLQVDGIIGSKTRRALRRASAPMLGRGAGYGESGGSAEVRKLQVQLRRLGLRPGPIDGLYGPLTAAAVARFQRGKGSPADGVAWSHTRRGVAAARRAAEKRFVRDDDKTKRSTRASTAPSASADDHRKPGASARVSTRSADDGLAGLEEALGVGLIGGLLTFLVIAGATTLRRKIAIAPATTPLLGDAARRAPVVTSAASEGPPRRAGEEREEETRRREEREGVVAAVGYVTADDSTRAKRELRHQISVMDAVCTRRGWRLAEVARDVGEPSGAGLHRPGLNYALERLQAGERSCLIVTRLRRLGDSAAELGRVLLWLRERGLRLVAVDVDLDTGAADGRIAADALISVGERSERGHLTSRAGRDRADRRPGREAVRDLPELRAHIAAMRSAGMTLQAIADRLNEEGVPTIRGGREWRPSSVQVAAGYRRPRPLASARITHDPSAEHRRADGR